MVNTGVVHRGTGMDTGMDTGTGKGMVWARRGMVVVEEARTGTDKGWDTGCTVVAAARIHTDHTAVLGAMTSTRRW